MPKQKKRSEVSQAFQQEVDVLLRQDRELLKRLAGIYQGQQKRVLAVVNRRPDKTLKHLGQ